MVATQIFFIFTPNLGEDSHLTIIFFKGVETTNQMEFFVCKSTAALLQKSGLAGISAQSAPNLLLFQRWKHRERCRKDVPTKKPKEGNPTMDFFQLFFCRRFIAVSDFLNNQPFGVSTSSVEDPPHLAQLSQRVFPMMEPAKSTLEEVYEVTWSHRKKNVRLFPTCQVRVFGFYH